MRKHIDTTIFLLVVIIFIPLYLYWSLIGPEEYSMPVPDVTATSSSSGTPTVTPTYTPSPTTIRNNNQVQPTYNLSNQIHISKRPLGVVPRGVGEGWEIGVEGWGWNMTKVISARIANVPEL